MTFVIGKGEKRRGRYGNLKGTQKKHSRAVAPPPPPPTTPLNKRSTPKRINKNNNKFPPMGRYYGMVEKLPRVA
jgi:hypothetical protein